MFGDDCPRPDLIRLAMPRRVYTGNHYKYVVEALKIVWERRALIEGMKITRNREVPMRHFIADFAPIRQKRSHIGVPAALNYEVVR